MSLKEQEIKEKAKKAALQVERSNKIILFSHIDADGITSGALSLKGIKDYDKNKNVTLINKDTLTEEMVIKIKNNNPDLVWFSDLGSSKEYMKHIKKYLLKNKVNTIITDHHNPEIVESPYLYHINPEVYNGDGNKKMSGSVATYLVSKELSDEVDELIPIALTGAVGDLQAKKEGKLVGMNRNILEKGLRKGVVKKKNGFLLFARSYKSISIVLSNYFPIQVSDFDDISKVSSLLGSEIDLKKNGDWRTYDDLSDSEREKVREKITNYLLNEKNISPKRIQSCIGEYYYFPNKKGMLKYADEFATLLNAASRGFDVPHIAILTTLGNENAYEKSTKLKEKYSKIIRDGVEYVKSVPDSLKHKEFISYASLPNDFPIAATGSVAGIIANASFIPDSSKLLVCFGGDEDNYHISFRKVANYLNDLDLGDLAERVAENISDKGGGGHKDAGAFEIDKFKFDKDKIVDEIINEINVMKKEGDED